MDPPNMNTDDRMPNSNTVETVVPEKLKEALEIKLISEEYKIWKKNTPFLCK
jgi:hypothetical protein